MSELPDNNPKTRFGVTKPNPFLVPPASILYQSLAMQDGAKKYGPYNWRENKVTASIYIAAAMRHMMAWVDGEEVADDSQKPHLGHALACLGIIVDALETGNLIDDRPLPGASSRIIDAWTLAQTPVVPARPTESQESTEKRTATELYLADAAQNAPDGRITL